MSSNVNKSLGDRNKGSYEKKDINSGLVGVGSPSALSGTWKALKTGLTTQVLSPKELKDNASFFKSPKYISMNKSEVIKKHGTNK